MALLVGGHLKTLRLAHGLGVGIVLIQHPGRFEPASVDLVEGLILADYTDWDTLGPLAEAGHRVWKFDAALSLTEPGLVPAARVNELLGLHGTPHEVAYRLRDKAAMRQRLHTVGVRTVAAEPLTDKASLADFGTRFGYPFVVKPTNGTAGFGVMTVASADDVSRVWRQVMRLRSPDQPPAAGLYLMHDFLMEEYAHGPEISVETFSFGGRHVVVAMTEKTVDEASRTELGHAMPARLDPSVGQDVTVAVTEFLDAMELTDGPSHTEVRLDPRGPLVIESHNRVGGGLIHDLVRATYGIDLEELALAWAVGLGDEMTVPPVAQCGSAVRFVHAPPGVVTAIGDLDAVRAEPDVLTASLSVCVGDIVRPLANNWDRLGNIAVTGADTAAAVVRCEHLASRLHPTTCPSERGLR
ncbi:ATP-grasp domain-containing protein [Micromonospora sp. NPDC048999]|uniref:ATP-grasp domain-containing protein n=1 Tax=Micromonospora sp. NPDC048999 TaxID=3155391 RepID=UPI0033E34CD9